MRPLWPKSVDFCGTIHLPLCSSQSKLTEKGGKSPGVSGFLLN
jgi:hypothetical protein